MLDFLHGPHAIVNLNQGSIEGTQKCGSQSEIWFSIRTITRHSQGPKLCATTAMHKSLCELWFI